MPFLSTWHVGIGDPTTIGWTVTLGYLLTAMVCFWRGASEYRGGFINGIGANPWWLLAIFATALGVNKQLDFQTLFIDLGRSAAQSQHWYQDRRIVQIGFVIFAMLATSVLVWQLFRHYRGFVTRRPELVVGVAFVLSYCLLRAAGINQFGLTSGGERIAENWLWVLELLGVSLMLAGALSQSREEATKVWP